MHRQFWIILVIALGVSLIPLFLFINRQTLQLLLNIPPLILLVMVTLMLISWIFEGARLRILCSLLHIGLALHRSMGIVMAAEFAGAATPAASGMGAAYILFLRRRGVDIGHSGGLLVLIIIFDLLFIILIILRRHPHHGFCVTPCSQSERLCHAAYYGIIYFHHRDLGLAHRASALIVMDRLSAAAGTLVSSSPVFRCTFRSSFRPSGGADQNHELAPPLVDLWQHRRLLAPPVSDLMDTHGLRRCRSERPLPDCKPNPAQPNRTT